MTTEKEFRTDMKKVGKQLAAKQKDVKALLTLLGAECPNNQAESEAAQPDDQSVGALYKKAKSAESTCTEYTCVYVAFQIWCSDELHKVCGWRKSPDESCQGIGCPDKLS